MVRLTSLFIVCTLAFLSIIPLRAQQPTVSIGELQSQIKRMEVVDRDPATPTEVRTLNGEFLKARRKQLHDLLVNNIEALRGYQAAVGSALSAEESKVIESSVQRLEKILQEQGISSAGKTEASPLAGSSRRPEFARPSRVANEVVEEQSTSSGSVVTGVSETTPPAIAPVNAAPLIPCTLVASANIPPRLDKMAEATAMLVVAQAMRDRAAGVANDTASTNIAGEFERHYDELVYLTVADALFTDAQKINLRKLKWQEFAAETARTDKQVGAPGRANGSTTMAEKPGFSDLLSFAIENGAIQKEVSETSLTLGTSPYALIAASQGDTSDVYRRNDFFNRIGISANFNLTNRDNVLANATRKQLNFWSVKVRLNRDRTARGADFQKFWDTTVLPKIERRAIVLTTGFNEAFNKIRDLRRLHRGVRDKFEGTNGFLVVLLKDKATATQPEQVAAVKQEILCRLRAEVYEPVKSGTTVSVDADFRAFLNQSIVDLAAAQLEAEEGKEEVRNELKRLADMPTSSFSYTNFRPANGSFYSVFKGMYFQKSFNPMTLLANGEISFYHKPDPTLGQEKIRDFLFALSFEGATRSPFITTEMDESKITYSFTGSYQRMLENERRLNRKADIGAAQFKLDIPVVTGFSLPLSLTYVNATEERRKSGLRFNFGFGLDTDKLAALLRAKRE